MRRFRHTLRQRRVLVLGFLLVETFFLVDGQQLVYAHQVREEQRELALRSLAATVGVPVAMLRADKTSSFDPLAFLAEEVGAGVSGLESLWEEVSRELGGTLSTAASRTRATGASWVSQPWLDAATILWAGTAAGTGEKPAAVPEIPLPPGFSAKLRDFGASRAELAALGLKASPLDELALVPGWNLVSLPEAPADPDA